jgi:hypothetical protein
MTISIAELPALSKEDVDNIFLEDIDRQSTMLQNMRDLAKKVHTANANVSSINSLTGSNIPWTITTNNTGPIPSLQGPVTYAGGTSSAGGAGVIGNGTYTIGYPNATTSASLEIQGKDADIKINGKSMTAWMEKVEERLNILTPNPELEKEWDDLRRLGERYRKLEKKCKEKTQMWEALKKLPKVKV